MAEVAGPEAGATSAAAALPDAGSRNQHPASFADSCLELARVRQDHGRTLLGDHHRGGVGIARDDDRRKHRADHAGRPCPLDGDPWSDCHPVFTKLINKRHATRLEPLQALPAKRYQECSHEILPHHRLGPCLRGGIGGTMSAKAIRRRGRARIGRATSTTTSATATATARTNCGH